MSFYTGGSVSKTFMQRWRSAAHVGAATPYLQVLVRRGELHRKWHNDWPNPQFGQVQGHTARHQWYADWTPLDDWTELPGVSKVDLDQSFDKNGLTVATIDADNLQEVPVIGGTGLPYHKRERGILWPWRGFTPPHRPGSGDARNEWYNRLPNAQILVRQGYGPDTAIKTFTGLIDNLSGSTRPDKMTISARDFGSVLTDTHLFGWNKTVTVNDPITFIPHDYLRRAWVRHDGKTHRWIVIKDAVDIVKCCLRWAGFKQWEIEFSGVDLSVPYTVDKSKTYMDVINDVKEQLGYVFYIGEPTNDDLSIGVPIFRRTSVTIPNRSKPLVIRDKDLLTDIRPQHSNSLDRYIIRVRGVVNNKIGRTLSGDTTKRVTGTYWVPWKKRMSGVIKQLTYYNVGDKGSVGFKTINQCQMACVLIAIQIALSRDTATLQTPGNPAFGLDSFAFVTDAASGVASRLYITNRKTTMTRGGEQSEGQLIWATELGGALCDNPDFEQLTKDFQKAQAGINVFSWGGNA